MPESYAEEREEAFARYKKEQHYLGYRGMELQLLVIGYRQGWDDSDVSFNRLIDHYTKKEPEE
jgi:hypothetical protein